MNSLQFWIPGIPSPGGSKNAFALRRRDGSIITRPGGAPVINMVDAGGKKTKVWRKACEQYAAKAMAGKPVLTGPLEVRFAFYMPRPKSHFGTGKNAHVFKKDAPEYPTGKPDVLKLSRSTEDALTTIVWRDDSQTVRLHASKNYADPNGECGCSVTITSIESP